MTLEVKNLYKSFGAQRVLANLSLSVAQGEVIAIVGPSGVGKSVLLKLIMGIIDADSGDISVLGHSMGSFLSEFEKNKIRDDVAVLFQSAALFDSLSIYDNVAFPLRQKTSLNRYDIHDKVTEILDSLSLVKYAQKLPQEIPMGLRKRAGMARALVLEPKIFLFDEPNTGLDPLAGQEVYDLISECRERWKFTGLVISHEIPEVFQVVDRVALLLNGRIVFDGTPDNFKKSSDLAVQQFLTGNIDGPIRIN